MNPLLEIDIFGYSIEDTKRFFDTIIRIDKERNDIERKISNISEESDFGMRWNDDDGGANTVVKKTFQVDAEGNPIPAVAYTNEDNIHDEGGLFDANSRHKPEEH